MLLKISSNLSISLFHIFPTSVFMWFLLIYSKLFKIIFLLTLHYSLKVLLIPLVLGGWTVFDFKRIFSRVSCQRILAPYSLFSYNTIGPSLLWLSIGLITIYISLDGELLNVDVFLTCLCNFFSSFCLVPSPPVNQAMISFAISSKTCHEKGTVL